MARLYSKKLFVLCVCLSASFFLLITLQVLMELGHFERKQKDHSFRMKQTFQAANPWTPMRRPADPSSQYPVIVWWSPLTGEIGRLGECGEHRCFFTINKTYHGHPSTQAFLFYGTDFNADSLPLPRGFHHHWALFHEESPKNNYKLFHEPVITLFNHTATFSRFSQLPLTTQYLESLEALTSHTHLVPLSRKNLLRTSLAPVVYVQSDCDPPSDRDAFVHQLMKHIPVDSYGQCLHNKELPAYLRDSTTIEEPGFYKILAQYKFALAFENAVCDDYITEKLWRPLKLGVVPVYYGAPNVRTWLPAEMSAVVIGPDDSPEKLAELLKKLDGDDEEYEAYLGWKYRREVTNQNLVAEMRHRRWGVQDVTKDSHIDVFECMVCARVWENINRQEKGLEPKTWRAEGNHLMCPPPRMFDFAVGPTSGSSLRAFWRPSFEQSKKEARALRLFAQRNANFTVEEFWKQIAYQMAFKNEEN
ncbi:alpha-(1,3)-fucosyltransferase 10 isoform X8 [Brienomyrus brachyistius]|uniref:alpha-(1,3)-fucosyltransferase 10 isoform X8 n=1 Tax=Brienomyrus brachyistius TaxID=42636 RepID=UPI0020B31F9A|nr:alpha-(1,3)-fucosyltransferase 10 isoform X8 [Brienomyrus brachyistius]